MPTTRRTFNAQTVSAPFVSWVGINSLLAATDKQTAEGPQRLYFGDLHNHNAVGYAKGSLARSIDLARAHLDFFAFTGHASWHDMPKMPEDRHMLWVHGFEAHTKHWPTTRQMIRDASDDRFTALLGYEWHSSAFGDYCLIFPDDESELFLPNHVEKLLDFAHEKDAFAIPHHVGYKQGWRGATLRISGPTFRRWSRFFPSTAAPNRIGAPFPMLRHSNGGAQRPI